MDNLKFNFNPRWKEELVCSCQSGDFILEMTMGTLSVFLPTKEIWEANAPEWAKPHWGDLHIQLEEWCKKEKIPLVIESNAWVTLS